MTKKLASLLLLLLFLLTVTSAVAQQSSGDLTKKIEEYQRKLKELSVQKNTLSSQIQYMNTLINLTTLKIQDTEEKVNKTQKEIELLTSRIEGLDGSLNYLTKLLVKKVIAGYKNHSFSLLQVIMDTSNASDLLSKYKYIKIAQENNQKQLIDQKNDLNYQKVQKEKLLADTQNDETKYQQLLSQAIAEFNAIQKAIATGAKIGSVKKGDPIALVGNSGAPYCSTGSHLHFEVRKNNSWINAEEYLSSKQIDNNQDGGTISLGSGSWDWPISDPIVLEQRYGKTPYSWRYSYSGGIHTGIDMWSRSSEVIRAPADGTLYTSSQNCSGATINIKYIDHGDGILSFYLHVQ